MDDARNAENMDVLRRKASLGRRAFEAHGMSPEKALNRALTRAAETHWNLAFLAREVRQARIDQAACEAALGAGGMIVLLDGPNGQPGFALIDGGLVAGLTEVQTFGTISAMEPEERNFTATDAAMTAPLLDQGLENFARLLAAHPLRRQVAEFRFGARVETARVAGTLMEAAFYTLFRMEVDLGGGCRTGQMTLAFPERPEETGEEDEDAEPASPRHSQLMMTLPAQLDAVLCRLTLSLKDVEALEVGTRLSLPRDALTRTEICAAGGQPIAEGTLGQMNGQRALRLGSAASPGKLDDLVAGQGAAEAVPGMDAAAAPPLDFQKMVDAAEPAMDAPGQPDIASPIMDLPDIPELDDLPAAPTLGGNAGLPTDFADLPDFPDLPDLPDFPMPK